MAGYQPLKITGMSTGLVQSRENFLLPDDAYPVLQNAYVWRERIKRKRGCQLLGRLQRTFTDQNISGGSGASPWSFNIYSILGITAEPNAQIVPGSVQIYLLPNSVTGSIASPGYTIASDCEVFTGSTALLYTEAQVYISNVVVVPGSGPATINGGPYNVEVVSETSFKLGTSSQGWGTWLSDGTWETEAGTQNTFIDQGDGTLQVNPVDPSNNGTIDYLTGNVVLTYTGLTGAAAITFSYYPSLPVMGIRTRELASSQVDQTLVFDQKYCYFFNQSDNEYQEFIPGTTWNAQGAPQTATDFFWSTNYWVSSSVIPGTMTSFFNTNNVKLFWVTNNTGTYTSNTDPVRITDGITWINFAPSNPLSYPLVYPNNWSQIDSTNYLIQWLAMLPFRGRLVVFNTWEGTASNAMFNYTNRIRWSTIGNPFIPYKNATAGPPATPNQGSWRDDVQGQGGFLDIPTSEDIVSVGFVRDNLVIYCENSTWQLRYTGRSITPFQIERVNSELGAEGTFSAIQFDTSLLGVGDKAVVECDSYQSKQIDIKIPNFVFQFQAANDGPVRVHGIRDFQNRLAYWTVPLKIAGVAGGNQIFPNTRLVYNYENDSWATFSDSLTALGTYQPSSGRTWKNTKLPWIRCNFPWISRQYGQPNIIGGNQQGFVLYLDAATTNDSSLFISGITGNNTNATTITSPNHNLQSGFVVGISGILASDPFADLNAGVFGIEIVDANNFNLFLYNPQSQDFDIPQSDSSSGVYLGAGLINIRDNFNITSKKFNFLDEGQNIQLGYIDILMDSTGASNPGAISLNVYLDYDDVTVSNILPQNQINNGNEPIAPDLFFNAIIPTTQPITSAVQGTKFWQRVFCPTRANFLTLQYTLSNAQMAGIEQTLDVQIDAQILWIRKGGRMTAP